MVKINVGSLGSIVKARNSWVSISMSISMSLHVRAEVGRAAEW